MDATVQPAMRFLQEKKPLPSIMSMGLRTSSMWALFFSIPGLQANANGSLTRYSPVNAFLYPFVVWDPL